MYSGKWKETEPVLPTGLRIPQAYCVKCAVRFLVLKAF